MNDDFVKLVEEMREAQKAYYKLVTSKDAPYKRHEISGLLRQCLRLEAQVDKAIAQHKDAARQISFLNFTKRTDEERGAYNVEHGSETEETSGT
jgi:hypothetical protein